MPKKKNQQNKPSGYVVFAREIQDQLLAEGHVIRGMPDLIVAASGKWNALSQTEQEAYKEKAKFEWNQQRADEVANPMLRVERQKQELRRNGSASHIHAHMDTVRLNEERRRKEREEVVATWAGTDREALMRRRFYFISFICLLEEPEFRPAEVAAVEFSLQEGVERRFHKFIDPGPIPLGYRFTAVSKSEETHKIPVEGLADPCDSYKSIYEQLLRFLAAGTQGIPPIFCKMSETARTEGCLNWLAERAEVPNKLRRIYELESLVLDLETHLLGKPLNLMLSKAHATDLLSSTFFAWDSGTRCPYHEEQGATACAMASVNSESFCIADYFCQKFGIPITGRHLPVKKDEVCYTVVSQMQSLSCSNNRQFNSATGIAPVRPNNNEDIAEQVARRLQQQVQEEEERRRSLRDQEEQKRRWASLRQPALPPAPASRPLSSPLTGSSEEPVASQSPVPPNLGRGRGLIISQLRRPGEPPQSTVLAPGESSRSTIGRGARLKGLLGQTSASSEPQVPGRWAGVVSAPAAWKAPVPPAAWIGSGQ